MYGDGIFLFISGDFGTFLKATYNAVDGVNEILSAYVFVVMTRGYEGCLVTNISDIGSGESGCLTGKKVDIHGVVSLYFCKMYLENGNSVGEVGEININLAIKSACTHEGLIKNVGTVSGGKDYYT